MRFSDKGLKVKESSTLSITAKAKQMAADGIDLAAFTAGEPDFDTPDHIKNAAIEAIHQGFTKYTPSSGIVELRKAVCKKLKEDNGLSYDFSQIVVSNGAKHSLSNTFMALLNPGDEVIVPAPYWLSYTELIQLAGGVPVIVETCAEDAYKIKKEALEKALTPRTKAIIINSPNNPTGTVYGIEELKVIADFAVKNDLFVISDEIYEKLVYSGVKHTSIASLNEAIYQRTIVINGFSKAYAMTGWRLGYTASSKELADVMGNIQSHSTSNPNSIAQKAAVEALLGEQASVERMRVEFEKRRDFIYERAVAIGLDTVKPEGAFYLFIDCSKFFGKEVKGVLVKDAGDVANVLVKDYNVVVVPCADFGFPNHIRLSYAIAMESIEKGMDRIAQFVKDNY